jgi:hypothetical protein
MKSPFPGAAWLQYFAIGLAALVIGVAVALASSPSSLTRGHVLGTPVPPSPSPVASASATPVPSVTQAGILGKSPYLVADGSQSIAGLTGSLAAASADGAKTWTTLATPAKAAGVAIDPGNPAHGIAGGSSIMTTVDAGSSWQAVKSPVPAPAPYVPLEVSPFDGNVWFFVHGGRLLRTRDSALTWRDIAGLPVLAAPVLVPGGVFGQFFLASGNTVFELVDNGNQVVAEPSLPAGVSVLQLAAVGSSQLTLFARGSNSQLYLLTGSAWAALSGAPAAGPIAASGNALLVGDGGAKLGSPGTVFYSTDNGGTWLQGTGLPTDQSVEAIAGQPLSAAVVAYCYGGDIYASSDGGRTWNVLSRALRNRTG